MELIILQTSDAFRYSGMLRETSRTAIEYAQRHGFGYECFIGIKRGRLSVHAAFNRILMLDELVERGFQGWALYMDADAYVKDLSFDLRAYLADKAQHSAIMATISGETIPWHINSGVLFFNLEHPLGTALIKEWKRRFLAVSDDELGQVQSVWDGVNDQTMLYESLDQNIELRENVLFVDPELFNHHGGHFIRQLLNSLDGNIVSRTEKIAIAVANVLNSNRDESDVVDVLYRTILNRPADVGSSGYADLIKAKGLADGIPEVVKYLLDSEEYANRVKC